MNHDLLEDFPYHVNLCRSAASNQKPLSDVKMLSENLEFILAACNRPVDGRKQSTQRLVENHACQRKTNVKHLRGPCERYRT